MAPKIERRHIRDITVKEGENIYLDINVSGEPAPDVEWRLNDKHCPNTDNRRVENKPYNTKLNITNAKRKDTGVYKITAHNKHGQDIAELEITVVSKPGQPEGPLEVNDITKDGCALKWKKPKDDGGVPIDHYEVEKYDPESGVWLPVGKTIGNVPQFDVDGLIPGHEYSFRVKAVNKEGESEPLETLGTIVAKDPFTEPTAPMQPEISDWDKNSVELTWEKPLSDGGSPITHYVVEMKDKYSPIWEKVTETKTPACKADVPGLIEGNEYQFRIVAVNKAGPSAPSEASKNHIAKARFLAPKIDRRNLRDVKISTGMALKFDVNVSGEPAPTIEWRFCGCPLRDSKDVSIDNKDYNTKFNIRPTNRKHTGDYTIIATNKSGRDEATVNVLITDKPGKPEGPLEVSDVHSNGAKLKWKRPKDDGGEPVQYYQVDKMDPETGCWVPCGRSTEPNFEVTNLSPGKEYKFRVAAVNAEGESEPLETDSTIVAKNPYDEPTSPTNLQVADWDTNKVDLKWSAPASDGGSPIEKYVIEKKDKYGQWDHCLDVPAHDLKATVDDLVTDQPYEFRVRAVNKAGPSDASNIVKCTPKPRNLAPYIDRTNLMDIKLKAGQSHTYDVKVTGEPMPVTRWKLNNREVTNSDQTKVTHGDYTTKIAIRNATRAQSGTLMITAENMNGKDSVEVKVTVIDKPSAPQGPLTPKNISATEVGLDWKPPLDDGGVPIEKYVIEKMDEATGRWVPAGETDGDETNAVVKGLAPGHKYKFRVRAQNKQGKSEPLTTQTAIEAKSPFDSPGKPSDLEIKDFDKDFVELDWKRPTEDGGSPITGYIVEKKDKYGDWEKCAEVDSDTPTAKVEGLTEGVTYEFRVSAVNKGGKGEPSDTTGPHLARAKNVPPQIDRTFMRDIKVPAGKIIEFNVPVRGEPIPTKEWSVKGDVLLSSDRIKVQYEDGFAKLRILDAKRGDTGEYTLVARNINGRDMAAVKITVLDVPGAPEGPLKHSNMRKNGMDLQWRPPKDNGGSEISHYVVEKMDTDTMRWVPVGECQTPAMHVDNLIEGHDYNFRVKAVNKQGESQPLTTQNSVTVKDPFNKPDKPGQPQVENWDKDFVELKWDKPKKDGGSPIEKYIIEKKSRFGPWEKAAEVDGDNNMAKVDGLTEGTEYEFRVVAVNKAGPSDPSDASLPVVCNARFVKPWMDGAALKDLTVRAGQRIAYEIPIRGSPKPEIKWFKDECEIPKNERAEMEVHNDRMTFEILFAKRSDCGRYRVQLSNELGSCGASGQVLVLDKPSIPGAPLGITEITKSSCHLAWRVPEDDGGTPIIHYIIEKMDLSRGTWSLAGTSNLLSFEVTRLTHMKEYLFRVKAVNEIGESEPLEAPRSIIAKNEHDEPDQPGKPAITDWGKDFAELEWKPPAFDGGAPIAEYIIQKKEKNSPYWTNSGTVKGNKGRVNDLIEGNEYEFRVIAVNKIGQSEPSDPSDKMIAKDRFLAPKITTKLNDIRIKAGLIMHLNVDFIGEPCPEVMWTVGPKNLESNSRITVSNVGYHTIIHIVNCNRTDSGNYHLLLRNSSGTDEGNFNVVVLDRPGPPDGPLAYEEVTANSVTLSWKPPKDNGGSEITGYVIEKRDLSHGGGWVPAVNFVSAKNTHCTVPRLMEGNQYEFRVMAENMQGRSDPLATERPVIAKNQFDVPGKPGKPEMTDSDKNFISIKWKAPISNGGSPITGYNVERRDKLTGRWMPLNREPIHNQEFTDDRVAENHSYEYRVTALNNAGAGKPSEASNMFTAKPMKEKPKLDMSNIINRRVKVRQGEPIVIDIPMSGAPIPDVVWKKDGITLSENDRLSLAKDADKLQLHIDKSVMGDAGKYDVEISNPFGKDHGTIDVIVVDKPAAPQGPLTYDNITQDTVDLGWSPPLRDNGAEITNYNIEVAPENSDDWKLLNSFCAKPAFTAKNLHEGQKYKFRVNAENIYGPSNWLEGPAVLIKSPFDVPGAPGKPKVTHFSPNTCSLEWSAPATSGGKPITGYIVERKERGEPNWAKCNNYPTPNNTYVAMDLRDGGRYEFRVRAVNAAGTSEPSEPSDIVTLGQMKKKPETPEPPKPDRITKTSATLSWRPVKGDNKRNFVGYHLEKRVKGGNWEPVNKEPIKKAVYCAENLKTGDEYQFRVKAENDGGCSDWSRPCQPFVIEEQYDRPKMDLGNVKDIVCRAGEDFSIHVPFSGFPLPTLSWFANDQPIEDESDARFFHKLTDSAASLIVKDSKRGDSGQYRIQLRNPNGFDTATINVTVLDRPGPPENVRADEFAGDALTLMWNKPKDNGGAEITNYIIEKKPSKDSVWTKVSSFTITHFIRIRNLQVGTDYDFRVIAENPYGQSDPAGTAQPIKARHPFDVPLAPGSPHPEEVTEDSITLHWIKPRNDGGSPITEYVLEKRLVSKGADEKWTKAVHSKIMDTNVRVPNLIENHEYEFRVAARNLAGQGQWSSPSDPILVCAPSKHPKITSDLSIRDMTVIAGQEYKITVPFVASPAPTSRWTINNEDLPDDGRVVQETTVDTSVLHNKCAKRSDTGTHTITLSNNVGKDTASCRVLVVDRPSPPVGPIEFSEITPDSCTISWNAPLDDGGSPVTNYIVEKLDGGIWSKVCSFARNTHYDVIGLEPNKSYLFRISAENNYGVSDPLTHDEPVVAKYSFTVPDPPGIPRVIEWDVNSCTLTWERPRSDGGSRIHGYNIEFRDVANDTNWNVNDVLVKNTTYNVYNLVPGHEYEFRIRARNAAGLSKPSQNSSVFKLKQKTKHPSQPGIPQVNKVDKNGVELSWEPPKSDGGARINNYIVERREVGGGDIWVKCADVGPETQADIKGLPEGKSYEFRVVAVNSAGKSDPSSNSAPIKISKQDGGNKPEWTKKLKNVYAFPMGKETILECSATGKPMPEARWLRNGRELNNLIASHITPSSKDGVFQLIIAALNPGDEGTYICEATNPNGSIQTTTQLKVGSPPRIEKLPDHIVLPEHDNHKVRVYYSGDSPMEAKLYRDGVFIDPEVDSRIKVSVLDDFLTIYIKDCQKSDAGTYRLELTNDNGKAHGDFSLTVTGLPGPPEAPLEVSDISNHTCTLTWSPPLFDGGSRITHYVVERKEVDGAHWIIVASNLKDLSTTIQGLMEGQKYNFRVSAANANGQGPPLYAKNEVVPKLPYEVPGPPGNPTITEVGGDFVHLEWTKPEYDGGSRIQGYWIEKREAGSQTWIRVNNINICAATQINCANLIEGREYEFRIFAQNAAGLSKSSLASRPVKIIDPISAQPPEIIKPLRDAESVQNHNAEFKCEIIGVPKPKITWYKGSREICNGSRYSIYSQNEVHYLIINDVFGEDADEYMCRAINKGGVKSTKANLNIMSKSRILNLNCTSI